MTLATALPLHRLQLSLRDLNRGLAAGCVWGLATAGGLIAWSAWQCGSICVDQAVVATGLALTLGVLGIGPVAAYGRRNQRP